MTLSITPDSLQETKVSIKLELTGDLARDIDLYRRMFTEDFGKDVSVDNLAREILRIGLLSDKAFQRRRKSAKEKAPRAAGGTVPPAARTEGGAS
jgi:hypothetical protein